jgi:ABC-type nickel/cobalt efflux system permease component RcnA
MQYYTLLLFGLLIGMQHALEADHLAAVATLSKQRSTRRALVLRGSLWGVGHTITLLTICGALMLLGESISRRTEGILEMAVGVMIVVLGANVLRSLWRQRPHIHFHRHASGETHLHLHTHGDEQARHEESLHEHRHQGLGLRRALCVGMMHGAAGSAGLLILATAASTVPQALGYVAVFGAGSIMGMAALSFIASFPLRWIERCTNLVSTSAFVVIGCAAIVVGGNMIRHNWEVL